MCDDDYICETMEMVSKGNGLLQLHCESGNIIEYLENKLIDSGHTHPTDFPSACPDWAEEEAINRAVKMAQGYQLSDVRSPSKSPDWVWSELNRLRHRVKKSGPNLALNTYCCPTPPMAKFGPLAKIGPPFKARDGQDRNSLWRGLEQGHISIVASDHPPLS
ncbi:MAG: hypothetical protein CM1200mP35_00100 [Chloroflexota bacterium]|nr:MAG: hypothetical protein CM1200mP35_00100 [Chloroflexota bacterium]